MSSIVTSFRALACLAGAAFASGLQAADEAPRTAGPYVPTPQVIVDRMLQFAGVSATDFVVDLGSGDGRIVRTAAKSIGASGFGVDIDGELVERSNAAAQKEGVSSRARFFQQDVFKADLSKATVVTLYVLPSMMTSLRPKLLSELRPGTRIVSHDYHFQEWLPDNRVSFDVPEKKEAVGFSSTSLYLWVVPASIGGRWRLDIEGRKLGDNVFLNFQQTFQNANGHVDFAGRRSDIGTVSLKADQFEFAADVGAKPDGDRHLFRGKVTGDSMEGEVVWGTGSAAKRHKWKATRLETQALAR